MQSMFRITSRREQFLREMEIKQLYCFFLFNPIMAVLLAADCLLEVLLYHFPASTDSSNQTFFFHSMPPILQASCGPCGSSNVLSSLFLSTTLYALGSSASNCGLSCFSVSNYSISFLFVLNV